MQYAFWRNKEMIKVAFFDIDGTLLSHNTRVVSQSTRLALKKLKEKGILLDKKPGSVVQ